MNSLTTIPQSIALTITPRGHPPYVFWVMINFSHLILLKLFCLQISSEFIKMANLSDFKKGQIVGARVAGARVIQTTELFGVARNAVLKVMTAFEKEGKTSSLKQYSRRKQKLSDRDCQTLMQIVRKDHKNTALKITAELNDYLENPVSSKTVRRELHKIRFHGKVGYNQKTILNILTSLTVCSISCLSYLDGL